MEMDFDRDPKGSTADLASTQDAANTEPADLHMLQLSLNALLQRLDELDSSARPEPLVAPRAASQVGSASAPRASHQFSDLPRSPEPSAPIEQIERHLARLSASIWLLIVLALGGLLLLFAELSLHHLP